MLVGRYPNFSNLLGFQYQLQSIKKKSQFQFSIF